VPGVTVTVRDAVGDVVGSATSADDGTWGVDVPPGAGYTAEAVPPDGYALDGEATVTFDVTDGPVTGLDFTLAAIVAPGPSPSPDPSGPPPVPGSTDGSGRGLAATGTDAGTGVLAAVLLVVVGAGALGVRRVRART
jgi:hypothetical protein